MKSITIFLVVSIVHLRVSEGIDPPFTLIDLRLLDSRNLITLRCRRSSDDNFELQALYFRNGSNVDTIDGFLNLSDEAGVVKFEMTRALEGEYSCGNLNQRSDSIPLIAFPDSRPIPRRNPTYAVIGETVTLQCGIQPGALPGQYFATWSNGTNSQTLYDYPTPSTRQVNPSLEFNTDESHYSIDRSDLSLLIIDARLSDSLENYRCVLGVEEPRTDSVEFYQLTRIYDIGLIVVAPPQFNTVLLPNTVVVQNDYVVFKCEAQGYPAPTISWEHGGQIVTNDRPSFVVNSTLSQKGLTKITTSYLKISSVDVSMVGEVKCIAIPPAARDIGEIALDTISTSTQLTVLGDFKSLRVQVTTESNIIIVIDLLKALVVPVNLVLVYTNLEDPTKQDTIITQAAYLNTTAIRHIVFSSQVTYEHFIVQVGFFSDTVNGPLTRAPGEYDLDTPTLFEQIVSTGTLIVIGVVPGVAVIVIATIIGLVKCVYFHKKFTAKESENQSNNNLKALVSNNTTEVLKELRSFMATEKNPDIRREALLTFRDLGLAQANLCKKTCITLATQTSHLSGRSTSKEPSRQTSDITSGEDTDQVDGPASGRLLYNEFNGDDIELQPPPYDQLSVVAEVDAKEQELADLLATCISDIVQATLVQDENHELANQVEKKVQGAMTERQMSLTENKIKQEQSKNIGTPV